MPTFRVGKFSSFLARLLCWALFLLRLPCAKGSDRTSMWLSSSCGIFKAVCACEEVEHGEGEAVNAFHSNRTRNPGPVSLLEGSIPDQS